MDKITMKDIAKAAKVSKSTVSRALSNDPRVNEETRKKVVKIAREMNYRPHQVAQALAKKNTNIIGVVLPTFPRTVADPFFLEFLQGIGEIAVEKGYSLTLPNLARKEIQNLGQVINKNTVDGVILTEPKIDDPRIKYLKEKEIPFVFLGNPMDKDDVYWVETDNIRGSYLAMEYLIKSGHKKIATVAGSPDLVAGKYRYLGYKKALENYGLTIDKNLVCYADFTEEGAYSAVLKLLEKRNDFTAIFVANDLMAFGVIKALKEKGLSIPEDIAVMGYDGIKLGEFIEPPLSTIKIPSRQMGRVALNLLIKLINGENVKDKHVLLPPELMVRESA
ncbi:LacI family DNA-binding transcriptional regulator [Halothermothrix orenii]|uniref:Transcriptional regulator, LacI family n=1 Tax=Halothermothrix orenii (strain H 168 / OCM 544 / DSM 9562) TaxID=373903 RepID=B8CY31_HALOH|nr:LacI family DNA-binding transcriptional regulator [Halothermothrix orenii]ACL70200.1 transcriptional regulator, LacI family [Halothermothrix orenii H 168]